MLWDIWKRWLASKGLPLVGAALLREKDRREPQWKHLQRETHPYYDLQVKVLKARNIQGTDPLSKADCYVKLWLPTASPCPAQTRMVANCSDPEWNETFHYQLHGAVKNVLELTLCDKDVLISDTLSQLLFDLSSLKPGQPHRHTFSRNSQDLQELQVEFVLEKSQVPASTVLTNGVLVTQPCLKIQGSLGRDGTASLWDNGPAQIQLAVPGAYEKPQLLRLQPAKEKGPAPTFTFHVNPVLRPWLEVELQEKRTVLQDDPSTELEAEIRTLGKGDIPLSSLPLGQEERHPVVLGEVRLGPLPHPGVLKGDG